MRWTDNSWASWVITKTTQNLTKCYSKFLLFIEHFTAFGIIIIKLDAIFLFRSLSHMPHGHQWVDLKFGSTNRFNSINQYRLDPITGVLEPAWSPLPDLTNPGTFGTCPAPTTKFMQLPTFCEITKFFTYRNIIWPLLFLVNCCCKGGVFF